MRNRLNRRQFVQLTGATGVAALAGCAGQEASSDGNSTADGESADAPPDPTSTDTALIEPETLKEWQDAGLVNLEELDERERVVVMRVWETDTYADGHVPGALKWDATEFHAKRLEGLANAAPLVPNGEQILWINKPAELFLLIDPVLIHAPGHEHPPVVGFALTV